MITPTENKATTQREENEMYRLAEYEHLGQLHAEIRREVAVERQTRMAPENRQRSPYVVRDLS